MGIIRVTHPLLHIANRWLRWILISSLFAMLLQNADSFDQGRSFLALFLIAFLFWFLLETIINWAKISTFSRSEYPLFPRYRINHDGDEWPVDPRALKVKDWLGKNRNLPRLSLSNIPWITPLFSEPLSTKIRKIHAAYRSTSFLQTPQVGICTSPSLLRWRTVLNASPTISLCRLLYLSQKAGIWYVSL